MSDFTNKGEKTKTVTLEEAFDALSAPAFSCWIKFHLLTDDELCHRGMLAQKMKRTEASSNRILRELRNAGYIDLRHGRQRDRRVTEVVMLKRAKINRRTRFVRLG